MTHAGSYSWCSTSSDSSLNYVTWDYCGLGNSEDCYFPFVYSGETYYGCADKDTDYAWCATSTYLGGQYYNYKYCSAEDLDYDSEVDSDSEGSTYTIGGEECSFPFKYDGVTYYGCTTQDYGNIPWCATETDASNNVVDWNYCQDDGTSATGSGSSSSSSSGSGSGSYSYGSSSSSEASTEYKSLECGKHMASQTLVWLNSPGNPIGKSLSIEIKMRDVYWYIQS